MAFYMSLRISRVSFPSGILWILPLIGLLLLTATATATDRVSIASDGAEGDGHSPCPAISADGRFVAFSSSAANLVVGDTNKSHDIFVHDRETGQTERVSVASDGTQSDPVDFTGCPAISADGRFVAFGWLASNLVAGDTNDNWDVFVHDRQTGTTERVSVANNGAQANAPNSSASALSADGRFVAFVSSASNLVAGDGNGVADVFLHDRDTGATERVSLTNAGNEGNGASAAPALSADGRWVAFTSHATNLVAGDGNGNRDIFVRDRQAGTTVRVSVATDGTEGNGVSDNPALSADGRVVAFDSMADNLVTGDANLLRDVFAHDLQTGTTERASVGGNGAQGDSGSGVPDISGDGRFVMFVSNAGNLVPGDTNGKNDVFVHDRHTGSTTRVSVSSDDTEGDNSSGGAFSINSISDDGFFVAFQSNATNLVDNDTNGMEDAFVNRVDVGAGSRFEYAAKIVCGAQTVEPPLRLAPGFYATTVNIHNPNRASVQLFKKLALTLPPGDQIPGEVLPIAIDELGSDEALQADCVDLRQRLFPDAREFLFEGYLVIQSPQSLDVTALYTAAALGANGQPSAHSSLHIEQIRERDLGVDLRLTKESLVFDFPQTDAVTIHLILYPMTVENVGDEPATGVLIRDVVELATINAVGLLGVYETPINLPPGGAIVNISPPAATFPPTVPEPATVTFELELGDLAPGDSVTADVWVLAVVFLTGEGRGGAGAVLTNTATVGSYEPESSPINNTDVTEDTLYP